jgi:hypothetical protein
MRTHLITVKDAAAILGILPSSVRKAVSNKVLKYKTKKGVHRLSLNDVIQYKARQSNQCINTPAPAIGTIDTPKTAFVVGVLNYFTYSRRGRKYFAPKNQRLDAAMYADMKQNNPGKYNRMKKELAKISGK